jgi:hypothetical protein
MARISSSDIGDVARTIEEEQMEGSGAAIRFVLGAIAITVAFALMSGADNFATRAIAVCTRAIFGSL